jgi:C-terminal of Roc, COR, domain/Ras of Complex, Roc, domain of DAPkinase
MGWKEFAEQIRAKLAPLPRDAVVAFTVRAALRLLPLLAAPSGGAAAGLSPLLGKKNGKPILTVFAACNIATLVGNGEPDFQQAARTAANAAFDEIDALDEGTVGAGTAVGYLTAAYAAYAAIATAVGVADAADAADAAADAAAVANAANAVSAAYGWYATEVLHNDIEILLNNLMPVSKFIALPLWPGDLPESLLHYWQILEQSMLALDSGFAFWLDLYQDRLDGKPMEVALMREAALLPESIAAQSVPQINAYLLQLREQSRLPAPPVLKPLNRVRAIFIGYGEAGKTSLIRVLHGQEVCQQEPQTAGIDIHEWPVPGTAIQAHFWDFGGQVMVHATHQLFLRESCLYVLVLSARSEINATEQAEYWLEHVKSFGGNSPVLIVGNRADQANLNINMASLCEKYPNIVRYFPLSCLHAKTSHQPHYQTFYGEFCQQLRALGLHQVMFTPPQFSVLQSLRNSTDSFLSQEAFAALCDQHRLSDEGVHNRTWLLDILDKLGSIIHFPTLPFIDGYVLNPRWLTYGVYTLMYAKQSHLSQTEIVALLCKQPVQDAAGNRFTYTPTQCRLIMDAMREFKLCYSLPEAPDTLIIPALLEANQPDTAPYKIGALAFELEFPTFLPRHIMPELIVQRHQEIDGQKVWQTGVVLTGSTVGASALLQVDYQLRTLQIWVQGPEAREYLVILRDEIQTILKRLTIDFEEFVVLPASASVSMETSRTLLLPGGRKVDKAPYRQLLNFVANGIKQYPTQSGNLYYVDKVLNTFISSATQQQEIKQFIIQNFFGANPQILTSQQATQTAKQETNVGNNNINIKGGNITGNVIAGNVSGSFNTTTHPAMSPEQLAALVQALVAAIETVQKAASPAQQAQITDLVDDARSLSVEIARPTPRKDRLGISLTGIRDAAQAVGDIAKPILEIAQQVGSAFGL